MKRSPFSYKCPPSIATFGEVVSTPVNPPSYQDSEPESFLQIRTDRRSHYGQGTVFIIREKRTRTYADGNTAERWFGTKWIKGRAILDDYDSRSVEKMWPHVVLTSVEPPEPEGEDK